MRKVSQEFVHERKATGETKPLGFLFQLQYSTAFIHCTRQATWQHKGSESIYATKTTHTGNHST